MIIFNKFCLNFESKLIVCIFIHSKIIINGLRCFLFEQFLDFESKIIVGIQI